MNVKEHSESQTRDELREKIVAALRKVHDPEIPVNIYDLGLIYKLDVGEQGEVAVQMTLTSPACPVAGQMPGQVEEAIKAVPGVTSAKVELTWDPAWETSLMTEAARLELGFSV